MVGKLLKMYAWSKAPKATMALLHPRTSARLAKTKWDLRHAYAPRLTAVGAFALALPIGYVLGRVGRGSGTPEA